MHKRIKLIRTSKKITQADFSKKIGISRTGLQKLESGENNPSEQTIRAICREFSIRRQWLEEGVEPMLVPELNTDDLEIDLIFTRQTQEERTAIKRLFEMPGGRDMVAKFALLFVNNLDKMK